MPISDDVPYLSRFLTKLIEIIAAGLATAVSGYLIAHLSGILSSPAPPQAPAPAAAIIAVGPSALPQPIPPNSGPVNEPSVTSRQQADAPIVAEPTLPQQQLNAPPVAQFTRGSVNDVKATASRKHIEITTSAAESKRDQRSFITRVQAALRNADHAPPRLSNTDLIAAHPPPVPDASAAVAVKPAGGTVVRSGPALEAPIQPYPPGPIEIESRPVTSVQSSPAPAAEKETGVLSDLEEILRHDPFARSDDAPRPPMPVGQ